MLSFPTKFALILEEKTKTTNRDCCLHCSLCACKSQHKDLENETILGREKNQEQFSTDLKRDGDKYIQFILICFYFSPADRSELCGTLFTSHKMVFSVSFFTFFWF